MRVVWASLLSVLLLGMHGVGLAQVNDPPVIVDAFERALSQGKIDIALAYFADDAVVLLRDSGSGPLVGKNDIRRFLQRYGGNRAPAVITSNRQVVGNTISWTEKQQGQMLSPVEMFVEAVVQDGKIKKLSYSLAPPPAAPTVSADVPARLPASLALGGVVLLATSLLAVASLGPRRQASASALHGKLVAELSNWRLRAKVG
jgi:hypothetical protein